MQPYNGKIFDTFQQQQLKQTIAEQHLKTAVSDHDYTPKGANVMCVYVCVLGAEGVDQLTVICTSLAEKSKWLSALKPLVKAMNATAVVKPHHLQVDFFC